MNYLSKLIKIQTDERKKVSFMCSLFLMVGIYLTFISAISISVFDIRVGAKYLPYIYIIFPVINLLYSHIYLKLMAAVDKRRMFRFFIIAVFLIHAFNFFVMQRVFTNAFLIAIFLLFNIFIIEKLYFMSMITLQDAVDIESVKRILPLATASFTVGAVIAVSLINALSGLLKPELLFLMSAVFILPIAYFADVILKKFKVITEDFSSEKDGTLKEAFKYIKENKFILLIIMISVMVDITYNLNDYLYNVIGSGVFRDEAGMVSFVASTETVRNIVTLFIDIFLFAIVISKLGSINVVKLVMVNSALGMFLILFGGEYVYFALISKVIFTVLVMQLSYSLTQILYQPVNQRYKDSVMVMADLFVNFAGSLVGGAITLLHSFGYLSTLAVVAIAVIYAIAMLILWQWKQKGYISIIEKTMNFSEQFEMKNIMGKRGITSFLPYFTDKIENGSTEERIFILDIIKRIDFDQKEQLITTAFQKGDIEIRFKIIDMIFAEQVTGACINEAFGTLDNIMTQYLMVMLFKNYKAKEAVGIADIIIANKNSIDREGLQYIHQMMFDYLCSKDGKYYEELLKQLIASQKSDDSRTMIQIMNSFTGIEDEINKSYLMSIMLNLKQYEAILVDTVDLCALYDNGTGFGFMLLKEAYTGYCRYEVIEKICRLYGAENVIRELGQSEQLIPRVYFLFAATRLKGSAVKNYYEIYSSVIQQLRAVISEYNKIEEINHPVRVILLEELDSLISSALSVVLEYMFIYHGLPAVANLEEHMNSEKGRLLVCEIVKNSFPAQTANEILALINKDIKYTDEKLNYSIFIMGGMHQILANLYMLVGGEIMEEKFSREIEGIVTLKMVPMFSELNIEELYEVLKIGEFKTFEDNMVVVEKGVLGRYFYIVIEGELEVYLDLKEDYINTIGKGEMFGEIAVIDNGLTTASVVASAEVVLMQFEKENLLELLRRNTNITLSIINTTSKRIAHTIQKRNLSA